MCYKKNRTHETRSRSQTLCSSLEVENCHNMCYVQPSTLQQNANIVERAARLPLKSWNAKVCIKSKKGLTQFLIVLVGYIHVIGKSA